MQAATRESQKWGGADCLATMGLWFRGRCESTANGQQAREHGNPGEKNGARDVPHRGVIAEWTVTIILLLFGTTTLVQAFVIPTGSMEDSLLIGDHLLVDKLSYSPHGSIDEYLLPYQDVKRGDIIVFRYPMDLSQTFVKRVVGLPGDRLRLVDKKLILNGQTVDEPYVIHRTAYIDQYRDNFPGQPNTPIPERALEMLRQNVVRNEIVVPPNNYFAMGDNRDQSLDSRYWGFVPRENIIGKPLLIYWSYDAPTERLQDSGISLTHLTDILLNFFGKTRWRRTFNLIHAHALDAP